MISCFFGCYQRIDLSHVRVGRLLDQVGLYARIVLAHIAVFFRLLEHIHAVAADVANGDASRLGIIVGDLGQVAAALFVQLGQRHADHLPFPHRVEPQAAVADGLFDRIGELTVPDLHAQHARLRHGDGGQLVQRRARAIGFHRHRFEQAGAGAAGAQASQLVAQRGDRFLHAGLEIVE